MMMNRVIILLSIFFISSSFCGRDKDELITYKWTVIKEINIGEELNKKVSVKNSVNLYIIEFFKDNTYLEIVLENDDYKKYKGQWKIKRNKLLLKQNNKSFTRESYIKFIDKNNFILYGYGESEETHFKKVEE